MVSRLSAPPPKVYNLIVSFQSSPSPYCVPRNLVLSEAAELAFPKKSFMEMSVAPRFLTHQGQPAQPSQALRLPGSSMPPFRCGLPSQTFVSVQRKGFLLPIFGKVMPWARPIATAQWVIIFYRPSDWKWDNHPTTSAMVPLQPLKQKRHKEPMHLLWRACGNGFFICWMTTTATTCRRVCIRKASQSHPGGVQ